MIIRIYKEKILFYYTFIIWFIVDVLSHTTIEKSTGIPLSLIDNITDIVVLIILVSQIVFEQAYSRIELLFVVIIFVLVSLSAFSCGDNKFISLFLFIVAARGVDMKRLTLWVFRVLVAITSIVILLTSAGILDDKTYRRIGLVRHSLGFEHPNVLGVVIFQIAVCFCILNENKIIRQIIAIVVAILFDFMVPNSQSPTVILVVLLIVLPIYQLIQRKEYRGATLKNWMLHGAIACNFFSVLLTVIDYSKIPILNRVDDFLSMRFKYARIAYRESGIKLLGQIIYTAEENRKRMAYKGHLFLDNAYATILLRYGIVIYVIFSLAYISTMRLQMKKRNSLLFVILFVFAIYGIMETSMFMLEYNFLLICMSDILYFRDRKNLDECDKKPLKLDA